MELHEVKCSQQVLLPNKDGGLFVKPVGVSKSVKLSLKDPSKQSRNGNSFQEEVVTLVQKTYSNPNKRKPKDVDVEVEVTKKKVILTPVNTSVVSNQKVGSHFVQIKEEPVSSANKGLDFEKEIPQKKVILMPADKLVTNIQKVGTQYFKCLKIKEENTAEDLSFSNDRNITTPKDVFLSLKNTRPQEWHETQENKKRQSLVILPSTPQEREENQKRQNLVILPSTPKEWHEKIENQKRQSLVILPSVPSKSQVKVVRRLNEKNCKKQLTIEEKSPNLTFVENQKPLLITEKIKEKSVLLGQKINEEPSKRTLNRMEKSFLISQNSVNSITPPTKQSTPVILANNNPSISNLTSSAKLGRPVFLKQTQNISRKNVLFEKASEPISSPTILSTKKIAVEQPTVVSSSLRDNVAENLVFRPAGSSKISPFKQDDSKATKMIYVGSLFVRANETSKSTSLTPSNVINLNNEMDAQPIDYSTHVKSEPKDEETFEQVQMKAHILSHECQQCGKCYSNGTEYNRHKCEQAHVGFANLGNTFISRVTDNRKPKHDTINVKMEQEDYNMDESISEQSEDMHVKAEVEIKEEIEDSDPLEDPLANDDDIDDDEDAYLQNVQDPSTVVQVDLRSPDDAEKIPTCEFKKRTCPKCSKTFTSDKIKSHIRYCKRSDWVKRHRCSQCGKDFATLECLENHVKMAHLKQKERCNICFVRFLNLQAHKDKYHNLKDVDTCNLCGKVVKYLASHSCPLGLDKSQASIRAASIQCPDCGNSVKGKYLKIHKKSHCVGVKTSTFSNFRTAKHEDMEPVLKQCDRLPLLLTHSNKSANSLT